MVAPGWHRWWLSGPQALGGGLQLTHRLRQSLSLPFPSPPLSFPPSLPISLLSSPSFLLKFPRITRMLERTKAEKQRSKTKQGIMTIQRHHANPQSACGRAELHPKDGSEGSPLVAGYLPSSPATRMELRGWVWRLTSHHSRSSGWVFHH